MTLATDSSAIFASMKTKLVVGSLVILASICPMLAADAGTNTPFERGLLEEEANHNLEAAIKAYLSVISQYDKDRKLAATAIFRNKRN